MSARPSRSLRIFVGSAAQLLTDHRANGEGLIAHGLLSELVARGHRVVARAHHADFLSPPGYEVRVARGPRWPESIRPLAHAIAMRRTFRRCGGADAFDVVWYIFPQSEDDTFEVLPADVPLVVGPWSLRWATPGPGPTLGAVARSLVRPVLRAAHRRSLARAQLLLSLPGAAEAVTVRPRSSHVVPFPIDAQRFAASPVPDRACALFVGRLVPDKGVRELIDAFALVHDRLPDAELHIAGEGQLRDELEVTVQQRGLPVTFHGDVPHGRVAHLLEGCSVFVMPSYHEPYGMAILEAMATGRAVVAGDAGGPRDLVEVPHGGRRVPPGDAAALASALIALLGDPAAAAAAGAYNRRRVETYYAMDVACDKLEEVLWSATRV